MFDLIFDAFSRLNCFNSSNVKIHIIDDEYDAADHDAAVRHILNGDMGNDASCILTENGGGGLPRLQHTCR